MSKQKDFYDCNVKLHDVRLFRDDVDGSRNITFVINSYQKLVEILTDLTSYEKHFSFNDELPSNILRHYKNKNTEIMNATVDRAYDDVLLKAKNLKTEKGKYNRVVKFFELLESHSSDFTDLTNQYIQDLKKTEL